MSDVEKTARDEKAALAEVGPAGTKDGLHDEATRSNPLLDQILAMPPDAYREFERKLLRKMDLRLIPWMTLLYLMSFLDRVNVGAAKLFSLEKALNLTSQQYSNASMSDYVAFEVPFNLVLKKFRPSIFIPITMILWAIFQTCMGLVTNYGQLLAMRFMLGMFESGLFPGLNFYLTGWYRREELAKRASFFFGGAVLAGAFGGIFGYGLGHMDGVGGKDGWSWIFIIEGLLTFIIAVSSFRMIHDWPDRARFLTDFEREFVLYRLKADSGLATEGSFSWAAARKGFTDWKTYVYMLCYIGTAECIYSQSLFSPSIVASLGTWKPAQSLLLSVPPYVLAFITTMGTAYLSDKWFKRGIFNMFWSTIAVIGYILLVAIPPNKVPGVRYFAVFLTTMAIAPMIGTTITWTGNNFGNHYKKAVAMGMVFSAGNAGGIISSQAYRPKDAKTGYRPGNATALAFAAMNGITSVILWYFMRKENRRREREYGPPPAANVVHEYDDPAYRAKWGLEGMTREEILILGDDHPAFRYVL
ncbi:hypothetical protein Q8F55_004975 [Vanrija albida]|uniref:Major facilitator superfamily (MFS) profile domain-containing protein n=1 Tax=Vanrija albida TaxID=181172 RepID=A0ABR3Q0K3_9TREE